MSNAGFSPRLTSVISNFRPSAHQLLRQAVKLLHLRLEFFSRPRSFETAVDCLHFAFFADEKSGRVGEKVVELALQTIVQVGVVHAAAEKQWERDSKPVPVELEILLPELAIVADFERDSHYLESLFPILLLQLLQQRGSIQAVVTPGSHDIDHKCLAFEPLIRAAHGVSRDGHTLKGERRCRVLDSRLEVWWRCKLQVGPWPQRERARLVAVCIQLSGPCSTALLQYNDRGLPACKTVELHACVRGLTDERRRATQPFYRLAGHRRCIGAERW